MSLVYSSDTDQDDARPSPKNKKPPPKLFGRVRPIHGILGGGKVADVLLWREKKVSAALLTGIGVIWFLFEVVEYTFLSLLCHIFITAMLVSFIWFKGAEIFKWPAPMDWPLIILDEPKFARIFHARFNQFLTNFLDIARGDDPKRFILAVVSLWIVSVFGNHISTVNFLFFGLLCLETLPFLYEKYEEQVDYFAGKVHQQMRRAYRKLDSEFLQKVPRGPLTEKKTT